MTGRIAIGQAAFSDDLSANVAAAVGLRADAENEGADALVLSELFLPGYRVDGLAPTRTISLDDPRLRPLVESASTTELLVGAAVSMPNGTSNAIVRFRAGHPAVVAYSKMHLWESERATFRAGEALSIIEVAGLRLGLGICYDAGFPEFSRAYAGKKVDILVFSSAFLIGDEAHRYDVYHAARALESGCYLAVSDASGVDGEHEFYGHSRVFDPQGRLLADLGTAAGVAVVEIDPEDVRRTRTALPYLDHLQPSYSTHA